jgi:hypothetical protein
MRNDGRIIRLSGITNAGTSVNNGRSRDVYGKHASYTYILNHRDRLNGGTSVRIVTGVDLELWSFVNSAKLRTWNWLVQAMASKYLLRTFLVSCGFAHARGISPHAWNFTLRIIRSLNWNSLLRDTWRNRQLLLQYGACAPSDYKVGAEIVGTLKHAG